MRSSEYTSDDWAAVADMVEQAEARGLLHRTDPSWPNIDGHERFPVEHHLTNEQHVHSDAPTNRHRQVAPALVRCARWPIEQ